MRGAGAPVQRQVQSQLRRTESGLGEGEPLRWHSTHTKKEGGEERECAGNER